MKLLETVYFSDKKYKAIWSDQGISNDDLRKKIEQKREEKLASETKLAIHLAVLFHTAGLSIPTTLLAARTKSVRHRKVDVLEALWKERGNLPIPDMKLTAKLRRIGLRVVREMVTAGTMNSTG